MGEIFDTWPDKYETWFKTPIGRLVKESESSLILKMLGPMQGELILDAGCGTGAFTLDLFALQNRIMGLEISLPMLLTAKAKLKEHPFEGVSGDMTALPFPDNTFDRFVSITAIEFIEDARRAIAEAFRVTKPGGSVLVATLNSLSPWAARRKHAARNGHSIFREARFRSPDDLADLSPVEGVMGTAIHFQRDDPPGKARAVEANGRAEGLSTGAFLAAKWTKPLCV